jgi:uncharacterized membrane-anchored protein YjiN (DUF445 family)
MNRNSSFHRMRAIASLSLLLMTVAFLLSWRFRSLHPALPYVQAFAEAAMIGGLADWFAIVALFRRPFGLPIPHTAIIPANKARIGRSLGDFLGQYLLDENSLEGLLRSLDLPPQAGRWLQEGEHAAHLAGWLLAQLPALSELWRKFDGQKRLFTYAAQLPLAPMAARIMARAGEEGLHQPWIATLLGQLALFIEDRRAEIRDRLGAHSSRWLPSFVDHRLADMLSDALIGQILALQAPEHRWRILLDAKIADLPAALERNQEWRDWQGRLLTDPMVQDEIAELLAPLDAAISQEQLTALLLRLGERLAQDRKWQETLQGWLERIAERVLLPRKHAIGDFTAKLVESWDDAELVAKLEAEVGADLHYIRLNGTLVGGLVGLALFAVTEWLG